MRTPPDLLARSAKVKMFIMLRHTLDRTLLMDNLGAHLRWMIDAESAREHFPFWSGDAS